MAATPRLRGRFLVVGVGESPLAQALSRVRCVGSHFLLVDTPGQAEEALSGALLDLVLARVPAVGVEPWLHMLHRAALAGGRAPVALSTDSSEWPNSLDGEVRRVVCAGAEISSRLLSHLIETGPLSELVSGGATAPPPQATDREAVSAFCGAALQSLAELVLELDPQDNLSKYVDEAAAGLLHVLGVEAVEIALALPPIQAVAPSRAPLPRAAGPAKELALSSLITIERGLPAGRQLVVIPLRAGSSALGTITLLRVGNQPLDPTLLKTLDLVAGQIAAGVERARLILDHRRGLDELQAISDMGRTMVTSFGLDQILEMIVHSALRFIPGATRAVIHLADAGRELLVPRAQAGEPAAPASLVLPWGKGIAGSAAESRQSIHVPDTDLRPDFVAGETAVRSLIATPLLVGQAVMGTLSVSSAVPNTFGERQVRILASLASQAAVAIENARLHTEAQKADEIAALYELGQALNSNLDLRETITTILSSARSLTFSSAAELRLTSPADGTLEAVVALGDRPQSVPGDRYRLSVLFPRLVLEAKRSLVVEDTLRFGRNDEFCRHERPSWLRSYLGVPLTANQRVVGVLSLGSDRPGAFSVEDLRLLEIVAGQAATALSNARLYEEATRRLREAEALGKVSRSVATSLDQATVLRSVVKTLAETLPLARHAFAYVLGGDGSPLLAAVAPDTDNHSGSSDAGIWQWCADGCLVRGQPVHIEDTLRHGFPTDSPAMAHSVISVPMVAAGKAVGVLGVDSTLPNAFTSSDLRLVETFADQTATAVESARLFDDLNRAYRDLAQSTETLSAVFNGITDGMYIVDHEDRIVVINEPEARFHGSHPEAITGESFSARYHYGEGRCEHCAVEEALATGEHRSLLVSYSGRDHRQVWREIDAYPIRDREGVTNRVVVFARDVTQRRRMEASLFESSRLASIGQLASSIAHEVNNPLTVIIGNAEVLLLDISPEDPVTDTIQMILRAARRAARTVQSVLDLSSQQEFELAEVDIVASVQEAIDLVAHPLRKAHIQPVLSAPPDLPLIYGSAGHLKVVWMNLILNARDAIISIGRENGAINVEVGVAGEDTVFVSVSDNGPGIPVEERKHLFQPFHTTKPSGQGLGLGLYNAYTFVRQHKGRIDVDPVPGEGARFTVFLPTDPESAEDLVASG